MIKDYIKKIEENNYIEIFCLYSSRCKQCENWIKDILIPADNRFNILLIDTDINFVPFKPLMSPSVYIYIAGKQDPVAFDGFVLKEDIIGYINTAIDIFEDKVVKV